MKKDQVIWKRTLFLIMVLWVASLACGSSQTGSKTTDETTGEITEQTEE
jgi:hypothetical protein